MEICFDFGPIFKHLYILKSQCMFRHVTTEILDAFKNDRKRTKYHLWIFEKDLSASLIGQLVSEEFGVGFMVWNRRQGYWVVGLKLRLGKSKSVTAEKWFAQISPSARSKRSFATPLAWSRTLIAHTNRFTDQSIAIQWWGLITWLVTWQTHGRQFPSDLPGGKYHKIKETTLFHDLLPHHWYFDARYPKGYVGVCELFSLRLIIESIIIS